MKQIYYAFFIFYSDRTFPISLNRRAPPCQVYGIRHILFENLATISNSFDMSVDETRGVKRMANFIALIYTKAFFTPRLAGRCWVHSPRPTECTVGGEGWLCLHPL